MLFHSSSLPPLHENIGDETADAPHRQLQSVGGASIEVVAIAFTGLIGIVGYAVQARSRRRLAEPSVSFSVASCVFHIRIRK